MLNISTYQRREIHIHSFTHPHTHSSADTHTHTHTHTHTLLTSLLPIEYYLNAPFLNNIIRLTSFLKSVLTRNNIDYILVICEPLTKNLYFWGVFFMLFFEFSRIKIWVIWQHFLNAFQPISYLVTFCFWLPFTLL